MKQELHIDSPLGLVRLTASEQGLCECRLVRDGEKKHTTTTSRLLNDAAAQLRDWFAGARRDFDLPLAAVGTEFQQRVWSELREIPFATTRSYGELAARLGNPTAMRAVGAANGRNPLWIIVPCHRVIGMNGKLTGYAGGLDVKEWLLNHERKLAS